MILQHIHVSEKSLQTEVLIMDFSKAFDKVSHYLLAHKLNYYGIQGKTNTWINNYLSNCKQAVLLEGEASDYIPVMSSP
jgi:homoserine acetyltransferase